MCNQAPRSTLVNLQERKGIRSHSQLISLKELVVRTFELKHLPPQPPQDVGRTMAPGAGLVVAAIISILLWVAIGGIIAAL